MVEATERYAAPLRTLWEHARTSSYDHFAVTPEAFNYEGPADVVLMYRTLCHVPPAMRFTILERAWKALSPDGLLLVNEAFTDQASGACHSLSRDALVEVLEQLGTPELFVMKDDWHTPQDPLLPLGDDTSATAFFVMRKDLSDEADTLTGLPMPVITAVHNLPFTPAHFTHSAVVDVTEYQGDGLRALLGGIVLPPGARVLDAADHAQNETGWRTADLLASQFDCRVVVLEARADTARFLAARSADPVQVIHDTFLGHQPDDLFDLVILDLISPVMAQSFDDLLKKARSILKPGGHLISFFFYDIAATFDGAKPVLNPAIRPMAATFLRSWFNRQHVMPRHIRPLLWAKGFAAHTLVDKWGGNNGIGWLHLERL
jgi:hypothetical protein